MPIRPERPPKLESTLAAALDRVAAELAEVAKALEKIETVIQFIARAAAANEPNADHRRVRARRCVAADAPWLLLAIVAAAWLLGGHHG